MFVLYLLSIILFFYWLKNALDWWKYALDFPTIKSVQPDQEFLDDPPSVSIVFSARNEEKQIKAAVDKFLNQEYPNYHVVAINDDSNDRTGIILDDFNHNKIRVVHLDSDPPIGWLGKTHALHHALESIDDKYILFTDGDVQFDPVVLRNTIFYAEKHQADHVVVCPDLISKTFGEKIFGYMFSFFLLQLCKPWLVEKPDKKAGLGIGAFNLVKRESFLKMGGYTKFSMNVDDDVSLGRMMKAEGFQTKVVWSRGSVRVRWQEGWKGMIKGLEKNFFPAVRCNLFFSSALIILIFIMFIFPFLSVPIYLYLGNKIFFYLACFTLISIFGLASAIAPIGKTNPLMVLTTPIGAGGLMVAMINSAWMTLKNGGIDWRGRFYSIETLRENYFDTWKHFDEMRK